MHFYFGPHGLALLGDVKFHCSTITTFGEKKLFVCWVNTLFIVDGTIQLCREEIDGPHKDKKGKLWSRDLTVEFHFADNESDARVQSEAMKEKLSAGPKCYRSLRTILSPRSASLGERGGIKPDRFKEREKTDT
jgi:hypothetical protein